MFAHAQAPCRIGIAGGGTDLPAWTRDRTGFCLSLAIRTRVHAVAITRPDRQVVASYSRLDRAPCATEIANGLIRESALLHGFEEGFEVHTMSEVTSQGSGLGVSSSLAVALAALFTRMSLEQGLDPDRLKDHVGRVARDAWVVEIDRLRRPIGRQDHMAAAYGGLRTYAFERDEARVERTFSEEDAAWVARQIHLVSLPDGHDARAILAGVRETAGLDLAYESVPVAVSAIEQRDPILLGRALAMGHQSKLRIAGAVTEGVARIMQRIDALAGIRGMKVAGAGGGGHLVLACEEETARKVADATGLAVSAVEPDLRGVRSEGWA